MYRCISQPKLAIGEEVDARFDSPPGRDASSRGSGGFFGGGGGSSPGRRLSADMSPAGSPAHAAAVIRDPGSGRGSYALTREWRHPDGPTRFHPRLPTRATVATLPGPRGHRCLLFPADGQLVIHNFNAAKKPPSAASPPAPIRVVSFPGTRVTCVAHRLARRAEQRDLLVGLASGEVVCVSLRALIAQAPSSAKSDLPAGALRFNTDGGGGVGHSARAKFDIPGVKCPARCHAVAWAPEETTRRADEDANDEDDLAQKSSSAEKEKEKDASSSHHCSRRFVSAHADGNLYVYSADRDASRDPCFPRVPAADRAALSVVRGARRGSNPEFRVRVGAGALTAVAFPEDIPPEEEFRRTYSGANQLAVVGSDGLCRVLDVSDWSAPALKCGFRSAFGGLDAVAFARRGRLVAAGGESDAIEVYDVATRRVRYRGEGHTSWVSAVAVDDAKAAPRGEGEDEEGGGTDEGATKEGGGSGEDAFSGEKDAAKHSADSKNASASEIDHRYDDLLEPEDPPDVLRLASVGQDCKVCLWDVVVDKPPATWEDGGECTETGGEKEGVPSRSATPEPAPAHPPPAPVPKLAPGKPQGTNNKSGDGKSGDAAEKEKSSSSFYSPSGMIRSASKTMLYAAGALNSEPKPPPNNPPASDASSDAGSSSVPSSPAGSRRASLDGAGGFPRPYCALEGALGAREKSGEGVWAHVGGEGGVLARAAARAGAGRGGARAFAPVARMAAHGEPCTGITFVEEGMLTCDGSGCVKLWTRVEAKGEDDEDHR